VCSLFGRLADFNRAAAVRKAGDNKGGSERQSLRPPRTYAPTLPPPRARVKAGAHTFDKSTMGWLYPLYIRPRCRYHRGMRLREWPRNLATGETI